MIKARNIETCTRVQRRERCAASSGMAHCCRTRRNLGTVTPPKLIPGSSHPISESSHSISQTSSFSQELLPTLDTSSSCLVGRKHNQTTSSNSGLGRGSCDPGLLAVSRVWSRLPTFLRRMPVEPYMCLVAVTYVFAWDTSGALLRNHRRFRID